MSEAGLIDTRSPLPGLQALNWMPKDALGKVAALAVLCILCVAVFAPLLAPYDPNAMKLTAVLEPPSAAHWFGTDEFGRDLFSRVVHGARPSLLAGFAIVIIGASGGTLIGCFSGLVGGWTDTVIMRIVDVVMALPGLVVALALTAALGPSLINAIIAIGILSIPAYIRVSRGQTLSTRTREYVLAAETLGATRWQLLRLHILPNVLPAVVVFMTLQLGGALLASSALSFIGLGMQPPDPEWGAIVGAGRDYILQYWWYCTFPGVAVLVTAASFNLVGDSLRDRLDSRSR